MALLRKKPPIKPVSPDNKAEAQDEEARYRPLEWSLLRRIIGELKPFKRLYIIGYSFGFIHLMLEMASPKYIQMIVDHVANYASGKSQITEHQAIVGLLVIVWGYWGVTYIFSVTFQRLQILYATRAGESVQFNLREKMFAHLQSLSMSYYDKTKLGRIISRMTSDINSLRELNVWGIWHIISAATQITISSVMLLWFDWRMFLAVLPVGLTIFFLNRIYVMKMGGVWQNVREGFTRVSSNLAENINGMRVVAAFNRQDPNLRAFNDLQEDNTNNNIAAVWPNQSFQQALYLLGFTGKAIIIAYGAYMLTHGERTIGQVVQSTFYWDWFVGPIQFLGGFYNTLLQGMAGAERVFSLLDLKPEVTDTTDAKPIPPLVGRVEFQDVIFGYAADRPVLHGVNLIAEPGKTLALVGHTGCGKSTIVSLIARFYQPQQGRVLVDGHDVRYVQGDSLHKQMGLVLQSNYLFTGTVIENIRYARPEATEDDIRKAAEELGTLDAILSLTDGLNTDVGERGGNLSLGQRQLVCFTRAYLADPKIFMLDEATSAVDTHTEQVIQASLERLTKGRTTVIVAHRLSTIMKADQILVLDAGQIIERGTHDELLANNGKYAHLYEQFTSSVD